MDHVTYVLGILRLRLSFSVFSVSRLDELAFTEVEAELEGIAGAVSILECLWRRRAEAFQDLVELLLALIEADTTTFRESLFWQ